MSDEGNKVKHERISSCELLNNFAYILNSNKRAFFASFHSPGEVVPFTAEECAAMESSSDPSAIDHSKMLHE